MLDLLLEGEVFGQFSLLAHDVPSLTVRAQEDTLCYLIPAATADPVLETRAGLTFVIGSMRRRIASATEAAAEAPDARLAPVERPRAARAGDGRPRDAGGRGGGAHGRRTRLVAAGADARRLGHRDRSRPAHARRRDRGAPGTPLGTIATFPVRTIAHDTLAGDALLAMFAQGVHHFPVHGDDGTLLGVVTDTDLMGLGRHTPFAMKSAIERAATPDAVAEAGRDLPHLVATMVRANADPIDVGRVGALVVDAMTEQLLALAIDDLGDPPCAWAWLALGSAARHEQALHTDQDHALVYDRCRTRPDADPYFASLAERVTAGLEAAGIPRCAGDAMAVHPKLRRPLSEFVEALVGWMDRPDPQSTVLSSIGYDFRQVAGPLDAEPTLDAAMRRRCSRPAFVRQMARRALDLRPPTGFLRDLVVEGSGASTRGGSTSSTAASRS